MNILLKPFVHTLITGLIILTSCGKQPPFADKIESREIVFKSQGITHFGTLTKPINTKKRLSTVILLSATPGDRNWDFMPRLIQSGMFLANFLSSKGYLVLRYDRMGSGKTEFPEKISGNPLPGALLKAVSFLRKRKDTDPGKIFFIAHADASLTAMKVCRKINITGLILLAPPAYSQSEILLYQVAKTMKQSKFNETAIKTNISFLKININKLRKNNKPVNMDTKNKKIEKHNRSIIRQLHHPRFASFNRKRLFTNPITLFRKQTQPILIVFGKKDFQNSPTFNLPPYKKAAGRKPVTFFIIPDMDYVLKMQERDITRMTSRQILYSYGDMKRKIHPLFMKQLLIWLKRTTMKKN